MSKFEIKRVDEEQRLVTGVVYEPFVVDTWGTMMLPEQVQKLAHDYMSLIRSGAGTIDSQHDHVLVDADPVESFVARAGDPDFREGAWVLTVRINDDAKWEDVKSGKLNGFSFEIMTQERMAIVETVVFANDFIETEPAEDGHAHYAFVEYDDDGRIVAGRTSMARDGNGVLHSHEITRATATGQTRNHAHRLLIASESIELA